MSNYAILVLSCDKYADLWSPFFSQLRKVWSTCPFTVYLGSNTKRFPDASVSCILSGPGIDWSTDLLGILRKMKQEYIFLWLDDFFPTGPIDAKLFLEGFRFLEKHKVNHIHIAPGIRPQGISKRAVFGEHEKGMPYRVNACGFWNKKHLEKLLIPGENPWKFEIMGSYRSSYFDGYYSYMKPLFEFIRVVDKGKISKSAFDWCRQNGIVLDVRRRSVETMYEKAKSDIMKHIFQVVLTMPWKTRVGIMETLRRLLASY